MNLYYEHTFKDVKACEELTIRIEWKFSEISGIAKESQINLLHLDYIPRTKVIQKNKNFAFFSIYIVIHGNVRNFGRTGHNNVIIDKNILPRIGY